MALSREDKADVKGALGKALANKVSKVTKDKNKKMHWGDKMSHIKKGNAENQKYLREKNPDPWWVKKGK